MTPQIYAKGASMITVYIALHPKYSLAERFFINVANQAQNEFAFKPVDITYDDRLLFTNPKLKLHISDLCKEAYRIKKKHKIAASALLLFLFDALAYDEEDEDLFFMTTEGGEFESPGIGVLSTRYCTKAILGGKSSVAITANSIIMNILGAVTCYFTKADTHTETTGCILDYCDKMEDIRFALKNGFHFCTRMKCHEILEDTTKGRALLKIADVLTYSRIRKASDLEETIKIEEADMALLARPLWAGRNLSVDKKLCLTLMPYSEKFSNRIWRRLRRIIKNTGLKPQRADDLYGRKVMEDVWKGINKARVIVADLSKKNANVFYELGIVHTLGKDCILLAQSQDDIPADLKSLRCVFYEDNDDGYRKLAKEIPAYVKAILSEQQ